MDGGQMVVKDDVGGARPRRSTRHISFRRDMLDEAIRYGETKGWSISRIIEEALGDYLRRKAGYRP